MSTPGGSLVIAQVLPHDHPDSGGDGDTSLLEEALEPVPVRVGHADIADLEGTFGRCGVQAGCVMSSKIPGFYRYGFPEKTVGNSRVLPPPITALVM